jgi:predicted transcriptional regulator of viral defense system
MPTLVTKAEGIYNHSLSRREVALLVELERDRISALSIIEARRRVGAAAAKVVSSLSRKGVLQRIRRGLYLVRPFRSLTRPTVSSTVVAVAHLLEGRPHYVGGLWACSFHHLTSQTYGSSIDAFVSRRLASRQIGLGRVVFHLVRESRLQSGTTTATIEGVPVRVSSLERTLLDALDHPRAAGGVENAVTMVSANLARADRRELVEQVVHFGSPSTVQRLGVLLERTGASARALAPLRKRMTATRTLTAMLPSRARRGPINPRWRVIENDR